MSDLELLESVRLRLRGYIQRNHDGNLAVDPTYVAAAGMLVEMRIAEALEKLVADEPLPPGRG